MQVRQHAYRGAAGFARQNAAGSLLCHTEVLQVGCVDLLGQGLQVRAAWFAHALLLCEQTRHQLLSLRLGHASVSDRWKHTHTHTQQ